VLPWIDTLLANQHKLHTYPKPAVTFPVKNKTQKQLDENQTQLGRKERNGQGESKIEKVRINQMIKASAS